MLQRRSANLVIGSVLTFSQVAAIVPVDAEQENDRLRAVVVAMMQSQCDVITLVCPEPSFFLAWNDWTRVPGGVEAMQARNMTLLQRFADVAPYCDVANGSCADEDECRSQMRNSTCLSELAFLRFELAQLQVRWWYSLRRESGFVARLLASCQVQGGATCEQEVGRELTARQAKVAALQPLLSSGLFKGVLFGSDATEELAGRPCNAKLPCLANLLAPILAATDEVGVATGIREAVAALEPDPAESNAFFAEVVQNASKSFKRCGFYHEMTRPATHRCPLEVKQLMEFAVRHRGRNPWVWLEQKQVGVLATMYSMCWTDCDLLRAAARYAKVAVRLRKNSMVDLVRYVRFLCDSPACLSSSLVATMKMTVIIDPLDVTSFQSLGPSKIYLVLSLMLNALLFIAGAAIAFWAVLVWKVSHMTVPYLTMLLLILVSIVLDMPSSIYFLTSISLRAIRSFTVVSSLG